MAHSNLSIQFWNTFCRSVKVILSKEPVNASTTASASAKLRFRNAVLTHRKIQKSHRLRFGEQGGWISLSIFVLPIFWYVPEASGISQLPIWTAIILVILYPAPQLHSWFTCSTLSLMRPSLLSFWLWSKLTRLSNWVPVKNIVIIAFFDLIVGKTLEIASSHTCANIIDNS
jgi:hypothetical protein